MVSRKSPSEENFKGLFSGNPKASIFSGKSFLFFCVSFFLLSPQLFAQARFRVDPTYEDSLRVVLIWNDAAGNCNDDTWPVGEKTRDFILSALGGNVAHVEVLRNSQDEHTTWSDVEALWGDSLPHVIVHANAGWSTGWNGEELEEIFNNAVAGKIGIVSVGDDAASLASQTFGFRGVNNIPSPLGDGRSQNVDGGGPIDSLWIGLLRENDNRLKQYTGNGALLYPGVNGIISNAIDSILDNSQLDFFPANEGRCQADADEYNILYPEWITKLGFQQGHWNGRTRPGDDELHVLVAIQDTMPDETIRRAVAVSYQPQFLQDTAASHQITYDAIMFASLAHTLSVASSIRIVAQDTSIEAGDTTSLRAVLIDQFGTQITDNSVLNLITWNILASSRREGDRLIDATGDEARFTATQAHRSVQITANFVSDGTTLLDTATIAVIPASAHHLVVEGNPNGMLSPNRDDPIGGNGYVRFSSTDTENRAWAIIRDRFGNYIENSQNTIWDTLSPGGIVSAHPYTQQNGEGIIQRLGPDGSTNVFARSTIYQGELFTDTITVEVDQVRYDSLRILTFAGGRTFSIDTLKMITGRDTSLIVEGFRSDFNRWEAVPGTWSLNGTLTTTSAPPQDQALWEAVSPADTGSGFIGVEYEGTSTSISARFLAGEPQLLALYPDSGSPAAIQPYATYPSGIADTVAAGTSFEVWAKLFDINGVWLPLYETDTARANQIRWQISTDEEIEYRVRGAQLTLLSTQAYRTINITASILVGGTTLDQTIAVYITHGRPDHLVIEAGATIANMTDDDPVNQITIPNNQTDRSVFAILRDAWGNFAGYSTATQWVSTNTNVFIADTGEATDVGEGVAERVDDGTGRMIAIDTQRDLTDTIDVIVHNYFYDQLRIVNQQGDTLDTLHMNTNQDTTLLVIGRRSNDQGWEPVQARWSNSENLRMSPTAPLLAGQWRFSPTDTALGGWIMVSQGDNEVTVPHQTHVVFDPGPPTEISLDILTPPENRIAGEPIEASVIIRNEDGKVPGTWCGNAVFDDLFQDTSENGLTPHPYIIVDEDTVALSEVTNMCFEGGNAVVELVLFHAPVDNMHTISVFYTDDFVSGLTDSKTLALNPGPVSKMQLVQNNLQPFPGDNVTLDFDDGVSIRSVGYDRFGNYIGPIGAFWESVGDIPRYSSTDRMLQIYYEVENVLYASEGVIRASYNDTIDDDLAIHITPQPARIVSAFTRDHDGNGYLDAVEVTFNKEIEFPLDFDSSNILVEYTDGAVPFEFEIERISPSLGEEDSVFTIHLIENQDIMDGAPQTSWEPDVTIRNVPDIGSRESVTSQDGAGPVVWRVFRHVSSDGDRTKDRITVEFSEDVLSPEATQLPFTTSPADLFNVWVDSSGHQYQTSLFDGISSLTSVSSDRIEFHMTNGAELTGHHLVSIDEDMGLLVDGSEELNPPVPDNRRARTIVIGRAGQIAVGPNPLRPTFDHVFEELQAQQPLEAAQWTRTDGGAMFVADIIVPAGDTLQYHQAHDYEIRGSLMIFDAIGNLVYERKGSRDRLITNVRYTEWIPGSTQRLVFYWNGVTDQNRLAAPGTYRAIMYLEIEGEQMKLSTNVGIAR